MNIEIETNPQNKVDEKSNEEVRNIFKEKIKKLEKEFNVKLEEDIKIELFISMREVKENLDTTKDEIVVFSGYQNFKNKFLIIHPKTLYSLYRKTAEKEFSKQIDFILYEYLFEKKYFQKENLNPLDMKIFSKVFSELFSETFVKESCEFEIKFFDEKKFYNKKTLLSMLIYSILKKKEIKFLKDNLDIFFNDLDITKSCQTIFCEDEKYIIKKMKTDLLYVDKKIRTEFKRR